MLNEHYSRSWGFYGDWLVVPGFWKQKDEQVNKIKWVNNILGGCHRNSSLDGVSQRSFLWERDISLEFWRISKWILTRGICVGESDVKKGINGSESGQFLHYSISIVHPSLIQLICPHVTVWSTGELGTRTKTTTKRVFAWAPNTLIWKYSMVRSSALHSK